MTIPRSGQRAVLLDDGRVLVMGGEDPSAELYDPASGSWTRTGDMVETRDSGYTATLLADGRVLVAGGVSPSFISTAEIYDPASGTWTATGSMSIGRHHHSATLLGDGTVLVAGGRRLLSSAELYDPVSGTWSVTGQMLRGRHDFEAELLHDGRVLVAGGEGNRGDVELYDPESGIWAETGSLTDGDISCCSFTTTLLSDGSVLAFGNVRDSDEAWSERYDASTASWSPTKDRGPIEGPTTLLQDGRVLVLNGRDAFLFDPDGGD